MNKNDLILKFRKKQFMIKGPNFENIKNTKIIKKDFNLFNFYKSTSRKQDKFNIKNKTYKNNDYIKKNTSENMFSINFYIKNIIDKKINIDILKNNNDGDIDIKDKINNQNEKFNTIIEMLKIFKESWGNDDKDKIDILTLINDSLDNLKLDFSNIIDDIFNEKNQNQKETELNEDNFYFKDDRDEFIKAIKIFLKIYKSNSIEKMNKKLDKFDEYLEYKNSFLLMKNSNLRKLLEKLEFLVERFFSKNEFLTQEKIRLENENIGLFKLLEEWKTKLDSNFQNYNQIVKNVVINQEKELNKIIKNKEDLFKIKLNNIELINNKLKQDKEFYLEKINLNKNKIISWEADKNKKKEVKDQEIQVSIKLKYDIYKFSSLKFIINNINEYKYIGKVNNKSWLNSIINLILIKKLKYDISYDLGKNKLYSLKKCICLFFNTEYGSFLGSKKSLIDFISTLNNYYNYNYNYSILSMNIKLYKNSSNSYLLNDLYTEDFIVRIYCKFLLCIKIILLNSTSIFININNHTLIKKEEALIIFIFLNNLIYYMINNTNKEYLEDLEQIEENFQNIVKESNYVLKKKKLNPAKFKGKIFLDVWIKNLMSLYLKFKEDEISKIIKNLEFIIGNTKKDLLYDNFIISLKEDFPNKPDEWYEDLFYIQNKNFFSKKDDVEGQNNNFKNLYKYLWNSNDNNYFYTFITYYLENKSEFNQLIFNKNKTQSQDKSQFNSSKVWVSVIHNIFINSNSLKIDETLLNKYLNDLYSNYIFINESINSDIDKIKNINSVSNWLIDSKKLKNNLNKQFIYEENFSKIFYELKYINNIENYMEDYKRFFKKIIFDLYNSE